MKSLLIRDTEGRVQDSRRKPCEWYLSILLRFCAISQASSDFWERLQWIKHACSRVPGHSSEYTSNKAVNTLFSVLTIATICWKKKLFQFSCGNMPKCLIWQVREGSKTHKSIWWHTISCSFFSPWVLRAGVKEREKRRIGVGGPI